MGQKARVGALFVLLLFFLVTGGHKAFGAGVKGAAPSLNKTSLRLVVNRSRKLKVRHASGKVRWSSEKKSVASVNENGRVTGKKPGTCKIVAKCGRIRLQCVVTVVKATPVSLRAFYPVKKDDDVKVLLCGSSSVAYWRKACSAFKPYCVINMGIGGSRVTDWLRWYKTLVVPYKPDAVVLYCGTNDINDGVSAKKNAERTISLIKKLHSELKKVPIFYVSMCSTPKRDYNQWDEEASNARIQHFCEEQAYAHYIDLAPALLDEEGWPDPQYFRDGVHPNGAGYAVWNRMVAGAVAKVLR